MRNTTTKNTTQQYLENAEIGVIVAFRVKLKGVTQTLSGMLVEKATGDKVRVATIKTKNGTSFVVDYYDIIWVKTGERWPRWIFEELKKK